MTKPILRLASIFSAMFALAACGGGGAGLVGGAPPPPPPPTSSWQPGVFQDASTYRNQCANPRSGTNPATGQPFPDVAGTTLDENNFLRSFTNDTYLWYDEIIDQDPGLFNNPETYFEQLRTFELSPTGTPKDQFSFSFDTQEWFDLFQGGVSAGYGLTWATISATPPRQIVIAFTEPNTPATDPAANLARGATVLSVDGTDIDDPTGAGVDIINAGLFPDSIGETHTFEILDAGAVTSRMVTLTSATITEVAVQNTQVFDTPTGRVGYLTFNSFTSPSEGELIDAINTLDAGAGIVDIIVDLRYNSGGFGDIAGQLAYMIAGAANTAGKTFDLLQFNDKHPSTNPITGQALVAEPFPTQTLGFSVAAGQPLPTLNLSRVFVLTGGGTASASELVINSLRGADVQVIQIGTTTSGKPYGFYEEPNCGTSYFPIQFRAVNNKNFGDYSDGFVPSAIDDDMANVLGCTVADDYTQQLGDPEENRLEVALAYQAGMGCVTPVSFGQDQFGKPWLPLDAVDGVVKRSPFASNLVMRRPQ